MCRLNYKKNFHSDNIPPYKLRYRKRNIDFSILFDMFNQYENSSETQVMCSYL